MSAKWWCVDCFLEVGDILQESASPMRSELLLWHGPCSEATAAPYFSIRVISWCLFLCCPKLCSAFCPAIQVFLSNVSWICIFLVLYINDVKPSWFAYLPGEIRSEGVCVSRSQSVPVSIRRAACVELCRCSCRSCWWRWAGCRQRSMCSLFKIQLCIYLSKPPWSFVKSCKLNFKPVAGRSFCLMWASLLRWLASWSEEMEVRDLLNLLLLRVSTFDTVSRDCTDLFFSVNSLHPRWGFDGRFL